MNLYYNLDSEQALHVASHKGDPFVIIVPLDFGEGWTHDEWTNPEIMEQGKFVEFTHIKGCPRISFKLPYPLGSRVGLRETWRYTVSSSGVCYGLPYIYKSTHIGNGWHRWYSSQCMPIEAIDDRGNWGIVIESRVDKVQNIHGYFCKIAGFKNESINSNYRSCLRKWFNNRYRGIWTWDDNPYCQIAKVRIER